MAKLEVTLRLKKTWHLKPRILVGFGLKLLRIWTAERAAQFMCKGMIVTCDGKPVRS